MKRVGQVLGIIKEIDDSSFFANVSNKQVFLNYLTKQLKNNKGNPQVFLYLYVGSMYYAFSNKDYISLLKKADYIYLDGFFISWVVRVLYKKIIVDFAISDFIEYILNFCLVNRKKIFILGSKKGKKGNRGAVDILNKNYSKLKVGGNDGYFNNNGEVIDKINTFKPDLLIVGLGLGKQEKWVIKNKKKLKNIKVILTVGNYIDILGGLTQPTPQILKKYHLRWLYRLSKEPNRLWRRYLFGLIMIFIISCYHYYKKVNVVLKKFSKFKNE